MLIWRCGRVFQEQHVDMEGWAGVSRVMCSYKGVGRCFRSDMLMVGSNRLIWRGGRVFRE